MSARLARDVRDRAHAGHSLRSILAPQSPRSSSDEFVSLSYEGFSDQDGAFSSFEWDWTKSTRFDAVGSEESSASSEAWSFLKRP